MNPGAVGCGPKYYGVLAALQILARFSTGRGSWNRLRTEPANSTEAVGEESMLDDQGVAALSLAHIAYERNDLDQAEQLATRALELAQQRANEMLQMQAITRLAHISVGQR